MGLPSPAAKGDRCCPAAERRSHRELDVLRHKAAGLSNFAIARSLSESSVEKASNPLFAKLGLIDEPTVHRRVSAVVTYLRAGRHSDSFGAPRPAAQ